jgi:hypothetical protein
MPYALSAIEIVAGILLLFGGGELFVAGSVALSLLLGIPKIVIGLTVVSMGTSAAELFVSLLSTIQGGVLATPSPRACSIRWGPGPSTEPAVSGGLLSSACSTWTRAGSRVMDSPGSAFKLLAPLYLLFSLL